MSGRRRSYEKSNQQPSALNSIEKARRQLHKERNNILGDRGNLGNILDYGDSQAQEMLKVWRERNPNVRPRISSQERGGKEN